MLEIRQPQDNNRIGGPERPGQTATGGQEAPGRKVLNKNASKTLSDLLPKLRGILMESLGLNFDEGKNFCWFCSMMYSQDPESN